MNKTSFRKSSLKKQKLNLSERYVFNSWYTSQATQLSIAVFACRFSFFFFFIVLANYKIDRLENVKMTVQQKSNMKNQLKIGKHIVHVLMYIHFECQTRDDLLEQGKKRMKRSKPNQIRMC